jgi:hypothetical protein
MRKLIHLNDCAQPHLQLGFLKLNTVHGEKTNDAVRALPTLKTPLRDCALYWLYMCSIEFLFYVQQHWGAARLIETPG